MHVLPLESLRDKIVHNSQQVKSTYYRWVQLPEESIQWRALNQVRVDVTASGGSVVTAGQGEVTQTLVGDDVIHQRHPVGTDAVRSQTAL